MPAEPSRRARQAPADRGRSAGSPPARASAPAPVYLAPKDPAGRAPAISGTLLRRGMEEASETTLSAGALGQDGEQTEQQAEQGGAATERGGSGEGSCSPEDCEEARAGVARQGSPPSSEANTQEHADALALQHSVEPASGATEGAAAHLQVGPESPRPRPPSGSHGRKSRCARSTVGTCRISSLQHAGHGRGAAGGTQPQSDWAGGTPACRHIQQDQRAAPR